MAEEAEAAVLGFAARHQLVLDAQIQAFLQIDETVERHAVSRLISRGYLERVRLLPELDAFAASPAGLAALDRDTAPMARLDRGPRRAVGSVWVWIRSQDGGSPE